MRVKSGDKEDSIAKKRKNDQDKESEKAQTTHAYPIDKMPKRPMQEESLKMKVPSVVVRAQTRITNDHKEHGQQEKTLEKDNRGTRKVEHTVTAPEVHMIICICLVL